MRRRSILLAVVALLIALPAGFPGRFIPLALQRDLYEGLLTIAGIAFGVMAAWIALLYPEARDALFTKRIAGSPQERRIRHLFGTLRLSTIVLASTLFFGPIAAVIATWPFAHLHVEFLRGTSFSILVFNTLTLGWAILRSVVPPEYINEDFDDQTGKISIINTFKRAS